MPKAIQNSPLSVLPSSNGAAAEATRALVERAVGKNVPPIWAQVRPSSALQPWFAAMAARAAEQENSEPHSARSSALLRPPSSSAPRQASANRASPPALEEWQLLRLLLH